MNQVHSQSRILVVDDDQQLCDVLTEFLAEAGYAVQCAYDGESAWIGIQTHSPDLILSDITMPRLDGVGLARRLAEAGFRMPIVLMSAGPQAGAEVSTAFVRKPFEVTALLERIARVLEETNTARRPPDRHYLGIAEPRAVPPRLRRSPLAQVDRRYTVREPQGVVVDPRVV